MTDFTPPPIVMDAATAELIKALEPQRRHIAEFCAHFDDPSGPLAIWISTYRLQRDHYREALDRIAQESQDQGAEIAKAALDAVPGQQVTR